MTDEILQQADQIAQSYELTPSESATLYEQLDQKIKRPSTALLIAFFFGVFGCDRFFIGHKTYGFLKLIIAVFPLVVITFMPSTPEINNPTPPAVITIPLVAITALLPFISLGLWFIDLLLMWKITKKSNLFKLFRIAEQILSHRSSNPSPKKT